jgi:replicative superfamily II helicase
VLIWQANKRTNKIGELVQDLKRNRMLPAIVFLNSSEACTQLALELTRHMQQLEAENLTVTKADLKKADKQEKALRRSRNRKDENNNEGNNKTQEEWEDEDTGVKNPDELNDKYTFLDPKYKLSSQEIQDEISLNKHRKNIPPQMFEAWKRGVGVHHANFHTKFRSSVECLFRK